MIAAHCRSTLRIAGRPRRAEVIRINENAARMMETGRREPDALAPIADPVPRRRPKVTGARRRVSANIGDGRETLVRNLRQSEADVVGRAMVCRKSWNF